jgi:hypothetical protein
MLASHGNRAMACGVIPKVQPAIREREPIAGLLMDFMITIGLRVLVDVVMGHVGLQAHNRAY